MKNTYVFTAIFGGYDNLPSVKAVDKHIKYVCFTDQDPSETRGPWEIVRTPQYFLDNKLNSRFIKTRPHWIFPDCEAALWIDGNLHDLDISSDHLNELLTQNVVAMPRHRLRTTVSEEAAEIIQCQLDYQEAVASYMSHLESIGFPDNTGLPATMLVASKPSDPRARLFFNSWWSGILSGSRRDQLSCTPSLWQHGLAWNEIPVDWREPNKIFNRRDGQHRDPLSSRVIGTQVGSSLPRAPGLGRAAFNLSGLPENYPNRNIFAEEAWDADSLLLIQQLNRSVAASAEAFEGNYCYMHNSEPHPMLPPDPRRSWKREFLRESAKGCRYALEIGLNAGHSASIILSANQDIQLLAIDDGVHSYSHTCAQLLSARFGSRFRAEWGRSDLLLPAIDKSICKRLDFIHIDGGHAFADFEHDLRWALKNARAGALLMVDDAYAPAIASALAVRITEKSLVERTPGVPSSGENRLFSIQ